MKLKTLLLLGRTSNLPTVWSNILTGVVLSGAALGALPSAAGGSSAQPLLRSAFWLLLLAGSAFYEGGMFLNDAFDADIDARERPNRPIPSGAVTRGSVYTMGFGLLAVGLVLLAIGGFTGILRPGPAALVAGAFTCAAVIVYNRWHKGHGWSPIVMGACRAGLYATAATAVSGSLPRELLLAAGALWLYIVGLTHVARFETGSAVSRTWVGAFVLSPLLLSAPQLIQKPNIVSALCFLLLLGWCIRSMRFALQGGKLIGRAVVTLIAGASLVDALFISLHGFYFGVLAALAAFVLTLRWQRRIPGT